MDFQDGIAAISEVALKVQLPIGFNNMDTVQQ